MSYTLQIAGRHWHIEAVEDQDLLLSDVRSEQDLERFPYGLLFWPSAVALAEEVAALHSLKGSNVIELGAGAGLPGMVARLRGATVLQTDFIPEALALAQRNADRNGVSGIRYALADWRTYAPAERFDLALGSDILYERTLHSPLAALLERLVGSSGRVLLTDPQRRPAFDFIDSLERSGWRLEMKSRIVDWEGKEKEIVLFELGLMADG